MYLGGRYRLLSAPLSTGSFGSVFVAEDQRMPRRVAVKILHPQHAENPTVRARFKRELEAACRVSHENVVAVYDIGEDPNLGLYYVMELVRGTPLKDYLTGEPLPWPFTYRVGYQLSRALHAIHSAGIVHRDLKPQNIMLVERSSLDELVKVLDFGIAALKTKDEEQRDVELTGARMVLGTPPYMSPEQTYMRSDRERLSLEVDARSDIYSLGVILYEMAAGRRPFSGDAHDIVVAHRLTKPMPLERMVGISVPTRFAELVMQCLAKDPKDRPASAKDVAQILKECENLPLRRWAESNEELVDPHELATQIVDVESLPMIDDAPQDKDTSPRLSIPKVPTQRILWAPIAALAALAMLTAWLVFVPPRADPQEVAVAEQRVDLAAATPATAPQPSPEPTPPTAAERAPASERLGATIAPVTAPPRPSPTEDAVASAGEAADAAPAAPARLIVSVMVTTSPPGATVTIGGVERGLTPVNVELDAAEERTVDVAMSLDKHRDQTISLAIAPELAGKVIVVNEELKARRGGGAASKKRDDSDPFKDL